MEVTLNINGVEQSHDVEPRTLLVQFIRESAGLTGTNIGCDTSSCGACTVHLNGESIKSCTVLAAQVDGMEVTTIEGLAQSDGTLHPMQQAFHECHALQCGYCTPGMVMACVSLVEEN
ncbi:MAG: (2Fe-2S)-binding protein, partial [Acidimicrobiales bacterium]